MAEQPKPFNQRVYEGYVQPFVDRVLTPAIDAVGYYVPPGTRKQVAGLADLFATPDTVTPTRNALAALGEGRYGLAATEGANALLAPLMITPMAPELLAMRAAAAGPRVSNMLARRPAAPAPEPPGVTAYHGSPHDFDAFDMSRIGTGEGAQAYGHGLYFAESPAVAESYKSALALDRGFSYSGRSKLTRDDVTKAIQDELGLNADGTVKYFDNVTTARGVADRVIDDLVYGKAAPRYKDGSERRALYDALHKRIAHSDPGRLYEVRIKAQPEQFLDWDKPLSQQPEAVKQWYNTTTAPQLTTRVIGENPNIGTLYDVALQQGGSLGVFTKDKLPDVLKRPAEFVPTRGEDFYRQIMRDRGDETASTALRDAGIPGIRYLDQGSRGAGAGTYNYVVFDDGLVQIVSKDGKLISQPSPNPTARGPVMPPQGMPQPGLRYNALAAGVLPSYDGGR